MGYAHSLVLSIAEHDRIYAFIIFSGIENVATYILVKNEKTVQRSDLHVR